MEPVNPDRICKHCGTSLAEEMIGGLCPRCLMAMNFASRTMPGGEPSPQIPPPSPEEMAARFPQFEILECLGRGGMGIVYKARQKTLDRLVAIKVLAGEWSDDPQFAERFSREARTLAKLSHPNIVTVHDFGESDGMFYLVMEFVDGVNLRDVLRDGRMEPAQALAIVPEVCGALQFAHDHGVVHRDIKPENILMDRDGRVKIADFGIAALVGAAADRSGTPPYMAPEQQAGKGSVDNRADIYALGVVFYEMLTGERPEQDPSRPSQRVEIDVRLDEVVLRALEKEPGRRYQTAGEFRTVVETMAGEPPPVSPSPRPAPRKSGMVRILEIIGDLTFTSPLATKLANYSALGFLGFLGRLGHVPLPGMRWCFLLSGFFGFFGLIGLAFIVEFASRRRERGTNSAARMPATSPAQPPRLSRTAIVGAGWLLLILLLPLVLRASGGLGGGQLLMSLGPTFLGWIAILQIRRSAGKIYGLGLALFVALFVPLLALDTGIWLLVGNVWRSNPPEVSHPVGAILAEFEFLIPLFALILCAVADLLIVLWAWRVVRKPVGDPGMGAALPTSPPTWEGSLKVGLMIGVIIVAGIGLAVHFRGIMPERASMESGVAVAAAKNTGASLEKAAREPYVGEWEWREGGGSDDFCILILKDDGTAVVMEDGKDGKAGAWALADGGITMTVEDDTIASFLDPDGHLVLGNDGGAPRFTKVDGPEKVLRDYTEAGFSGDVERALGKIGPPLTETWDEVSKALIHLQLGEKDGTRPLELAEWHREGDYAVARYENPPELKTSGFVILERAGTTWRVVWVSGSWIESTFADYLGAFGRFRLVDRGDARKVAGAFITAVRNGDPNLAMMLSGFPLSGNPGEFGEVFPSGPESEPTSLLRWHQEGPYAVTRAKFPAEHPDMETTLGLAKTGRVWRVVWAAASEPDASLADDLKRFKDDRLLARVLVEDHALHFLVAIRDKDEKTLRELCVDRTEGWTEALVGHFAMELRERFRQQTGEEFAMYPDDIRVEKDLAVVTCRAFREVQKKLGGTILVLHFCRTESGWKVWSARNAPESQPIEQHLEQARKWAAEWKNQEPDTNGRDEARKTEHAACSFMTAVRDGDIDAAMKWMLPSMKAHAEIRKALEGLSKELRESAYAGKLDRLTEFTEWYPEKPDANTRFVGIRIAGVPANDGSGRELGLYLILSPTPEGWKVAHLDDASSDKPLSQYVDRIMRILPGEGPEFRGEPTESPAPGDATPATVRLPAWRSKELNTMKEYATALAMFQEDAGSLPPTLEMLVTRKILPELKLMENHATGNREIPLYHGGPDLQVGDSDTSRIMLLAAPSPSPDGRRVVGFLDASVKVIDENRYQSQLAWQRKPPMERTIDSFLESCAEKQVADDRQMFAALGMPEFIKRFGDGLGAMRKHREQLHPAMRWAFDETTGKPSAAFTRYLRGVHRDGDPRHAKQAFLMLKMLGVEEHPADGASAEDLPQPDRDMLLAHARALEKGDFASLERTWEFQDDFERRFGRLLAAAFARQEAMTVELVSTKRLNKNSLFACYLVRSGPELFGSADAPLFATFQHRGDRWRCSPPFSLRTVVAARTMGGQQIGRRGIAEKLIYQRYGHGDRAEQLARMKAMRDAAECLARPPHKLMTYEGLAESLKTAIRTEEEASKESWRDSWHKLIKEQPKEVLPGPGDFFVSFYRECDPDDAELSHSLPFAGEEGSFRAERFPCMTDNMLLEAQIKAVPGSNDPQIEIQFTASGARILESVTRQSIGKRLACVVDGKVISAPTVMTSINTGRVVVTGGISQEEVEVIVKKINTSRDQARDFLDSLEQEQAAADVNQ